MELDTYNKLKHDVLPNGCYRNDSVYSTAGLLDTTKRSQKICGMNMFVLLAFIGFTCVGVLMGTMMMSGIFGSDKEKAASAGANTGTKPGSDEEEMKKALAMLEALKTDIANLQSKFEDLQYLPGFDYMINDTLLAQMLENHIKIITLENNFDDTNATAENLAKEADVVEGVLESYGEDMNELNRTVILNQDQITALQDEFSISEEMIEQLNDSLNSQDDQISLLHANEVTFNEEITILDNSWDDSNQLIEHNQNEIVYVAGNVSTTILNINESIYAQIDIIKNMSGPRGINGSQGPAGGSDGRLADCEYHNVTESDDINSTESTEARYEIPDGFVLTGAYCSVYGGTEQRLEIPYDQSIIACTCYGDPGSNFKPADGSFSCTVNVWICPENLS